MSKITIDSLACSAVSKGCF